MSRLSMVLACAAVAGCGSDPPNVVDGPPPDGAPDAPVEDVYDELTRTMKAELAFAGTAAAALAIIERGEVTYTHGFGHLRPGDATPVSPSTRFRIASLSKMLTAVAVLQQVQAGTLGLATPVTTYLPELDVASGAAWLPAVTPHDLLAHGSGMSRGYEQDAGCPPDDAGLGCWVGSQGFADNVWLMSPPARMWSYSNVGYRVLGAALERASGTSFVAYMHDRVFEPLGMTRTTYLPTEVLADGDYAVGDALDLGVTQFAEAWRRPSGGAFSTVLDLAKVAQFLIRGDAAVLAPALFDAMTSAQLNTDWTLDFEHYGYGLFVDRGIALVDYLPYDFKTLLHDGLLPGYNSLVVAIPSREFAFVLLAAGAPAYPSKSIDLMLHRVLGLPTVDPIDLSEDPATFGRYAGEYTCWTPTGTVTLAVTFEGGALHASGAIGCTLVPQKAGNFTCGDAWLTFDRREAPAAYVRWNDLVGHRVAP